jgi:hypothetical protein
MPKRLLLSICLVVSAIAFLYSQMGIAMAYWVAAVPGNSPEHIRLNFLVWIPAALVTCALCVWLGSRLTGSSR